MALLLMEATAPAEATLTVVHVPSEMRWAVDVRGKSPAEIALHLSHWWSKLGSGACLVVASADSSERARALSEHATGTLRELGCMAAGFLHTGGTLTEPDGTTVRLADVIASLPGDLDAPVCEPVRLWAGVRNQVFDPVAPQEPVSPAVAVAAAARAVREGALPTEELVRLMSGVSRIDPNLLVQGMVAEAVESADGYGDVIRQVALDPAVPDLDRLTAAAVTLAFAAQHTVPGDEADQLGAWAGTVFWLTGRRASVDYQRSILAAAGADRKADMLATLATLEPAWLTAQARR